jgi:hypothetical protein
LLSIAASDHGLAGVGAIQVANNRSHPGTFRETQFRAQRAQIKLDRLGRRRHISLSRSVYVRVRDRAGNLSKWRRATRAR